MSIGKTEKDFETINSNFASLLHPNIRKLLAIKQINPEDLRRHYFGVDEAVSIHNVEKYVKLCTDLYFLYGIIEVWKSQTKSKSSTYCYQFSYDKEISLVKTVYDLNFLPGTIIDKQPWFVTLVTELILC